MNDKTTPPQSARDKQRERYQAASTEGVTHIPATRTPPQNVFDDPSEKRVAVYVRVSTDDPRQTSSFELQKSHYTELVESHKNWRLVDIYADEGLSGTSVNKRREFRAF